MRLNYTLLLTDISKKQGLGLLPTEMPLIIHTDILIYTMAYIMHEDETYLTIVVPNDDGAEFAKIIPKDTILSVDVMYQQMLDKPKETKGDVMYG